LHVIDGDEKKRNKIFQEVGEHCIHIISSGLVSWLDGKREKRISKNTGKQYTVFKPNELTPEYDLIIVDECSQFKNVSTDRFKALKKLIRRGLFLLSGTPFSNVRQDEDKKGYISYVNADELYYAFYLLNIYKKTLTEFREDFCYSLKWEEHNYRMTTQIYDTMIEVMHEHSITKKLNISVSKNIHKVYCESDKERHNTLVEEYYFVTKGDEEIMVANKADMINKSLQLSNGFAYDYTGDMVRLNTFKYERLLDVLSVTTDNVIIFYNFVEDREFLLRNLPNAVLYQGTEEETAWNNGEIKILILSPFSQKYGLNLQDGGHTIIWFGLVWSAESYSQANARLYRRGQNHDVDIYYLMAEGTYDDYVYDILVAKLKVIDDFVSYTENVKT
jgi:SNF2 family DNA or RNA helicase